MESDNSWASFPAGTRASRPASSDVRRKVVTACGMLLVAMVSAIVTGVAGARPIPYTTSVEILGQVSADGSAAVLTYSLSRPTALFRMGRGNSLPGSTALRVRGQDVKLIEGSVRSSHAFSRFELIIPFDQPTPSFRFVPAGKVSAASFVLFAPYFLPADTNARYRLVLRNREGFAVVPPARAEHGYVIADAPTEARSRYDLWKADGIPDALASAAISGLDDATSLYQRRLGFSPAERPSIVVGTLRGGSEAGQSIRFEGDVTPNGTAFLRFSVPVNWSGPAADDVASVRRFVAHEAFHLWNARRRQVDGRRTWLHEGAAEYFGWLATSLEAEGGDWLSERLDRALRVCSGRLRARSLDDLDEATARGVQYECGAVAHWIMDVAIRHDSSGLRSAFDVWRRTLRSRTGAHWYFDEDFEAAADRESRPAARALRALWHGRGASRWPEIAATANEAGASVRVSSPSHEQSRAVSVRALAISACGRVDGVGEDRQGLAVWAPAGCALLPGTVRVLAIDGVDPMADPSRFHSQVEKACKTARRLHAMLRTSSGVRSSDLPCSVLVEPLIPELRVVRALPRFARSDPLSEP